MESELIEAQLSGRVLYGEGLTPGEIQSWYQQALTTHRAQLAEYRRAASGESRNPYEYDALDHFHVLDALLRHRYSCCVALGCAAGDDVAPLAPVVERFLAIEPIQEFWRPEIGGKPARYMNPSIFGDIDLDADAADLATSFDVLHHIPNVSHVVGEIARVLRPGGLFVVREPISWMGDWRQPRAGLTANERGLPLEWFEQMVREKGFSIVRRRLCMFRPLTLVLQKLGISRPLAHMPIIVSDWIMSELLSWNIHYRRDGLVKKLAPSSAFWLLRRN